jgi:hypothetical protein
MGRTNRAHFWPILAALLLTVAANVARGDDPPIDWNRAQEIYQRSQRGEALSPEDQAYLDRAKTERQKMQARGPVAGKTSVGLTPLTDLKDAYKGQSGGLYGDGRNDPPAALLSAAKAAATRIKPLDREGGASPDGKIVLLAIGMSNTTQEFSRFKQIADRDPGKSPGMVIVDGAQGGQDAAAWVDERKAPAVWKAAEQRLAAQGVTPAQVQAVWIKQALIQPGAIGEFPVHAKKLQADIETIVNMARTRYPNLRLVYLSSRIYAGYANTPLNPEPYAYESAFAVRWVIEEQLAKLGSDPQATVVLWGPYVWADGVKGRKSDDLVWKAEDLGPDGTHPSQTGQMKVAQLLLKFFENDPTAKEWFAAKEK